MSFATALTTEELIAKLRKAGAIWFRNDDLLMLEELIRRMSQQKDIAK